MRLDVASRVRNLVEKPIPAASYASRGEFSTSEVLVIAKLRAAAVFVNGEHCMCVGAAAGWKLLERRFRERYWRGGWDAKVRFACWFVCLLVCLLACFHRFRGYGARFKYTLNSNSVVSLIARVA